MWEDAGWLRYPCGGRKEAPTKTHKLALCEEMPKLLESTCTSDEDCKPTAICHNNVCSCPPLTLPNAGKSACVSLCPEGWSYYETTNVCFKLKSTSGEGLTGAKTVCAEDNAVLGIIDSAEKKEIVSDKRKDKLTVGKTSHEAFVSALEVQANDLVIFQTKIAPCCRGIFWLISHVTGQGTQKLFVSSHYLLIPQPIADRQKIVISDLAATDDAASVLKGGPGSIRAAYATRYLIPFKAFKKQLMPVQPLILF
ncbi:unnamed protein product [Cyprideis torosa]|uniref:Uncharacterized protein n=1 Tax=Cyprideis torosa TaxID=163714 RepID=A0A7R8WM99_9CRUS|nr:unnamed protein product [Cyprideis torosa]CAG0899021.1 unnamed protein product [Cyprideis torosa]